MHELKWAFHDAEYSIQRTANALDGDIEKLKAIMSEYRKTAGQVAEYSRQLEALGIKQG
jgi:hypothetical protein